MLPLSVTNAPPAGAGELRVTLPAAVPPAGTECWLNESEERLAAGIGFPTGVTTSEHCGARYPSTSVPVSIVTRVETDVTFVTMEKSAPVMPSGIKTVDGGTT